jgi:hypothetical protein
VYIPPASNRNGMACEIKYHRRIPSGKNSPKPQKAGEVFNDIFRLARFEPKKKISRYLLYITDAEMASYFGSSQNRFTDLFNLPGNQRLRITEAYCTSDRCETFVNQVTGNFSPSEVIRKFPSLVFPDNNWIRIYKIQPRKP